MKLNFKSFQDCESLQTALKNCLAIDQATTIDLENFAQEQGITCNIRDITYSDGYSPHLINVQFDTVMSCCATAPAEKSWFSFSNGWVWLIDFYFAHGKLVQIIVSQAGNGL